MSTPEIFYLSVMWNDPAFITRGRGARFGLTGFVGPIDSSPLQESMSQ